MTQHTQPSNIESQDNVKYGSLEHDDKYGDLFKKPEPTKFNDSLHQQIDIKPIQNTLDCV